MSFSDNLKLTFSELGQGFTVWRSQVIALAKNDFSKSTRKSALGWFWLVFQPFVYVGCFWFALYIGIKHAKGGLDGLEYLLWLTCGVFPWWFMRSSLNGSPDVFSSHSFLVTRLKFPVALIPVFAELAHFILHLILVAILLVFSFLVVGMPSIYILQLPLLMLMMYVFFTGYSLLMGSLCSFSKDLSQLLKALTTPIFWLSGILFDVTDISNSLVQTALLFDPVSFFVRSYRMALSGVDGGWFWQDPVFLACGLGVMIVTIVLGVLVFSKVRRDLSDVL